MIPRRTTSNDDQSVTDREQARSDEDQSLSDGDQTASGRDHGRYDTARSLDARARERDLAALERDEAAAMRDEAAEARDAEFARLVAGLGIEHPTNGAQLILRASRERQRAVGDRARAAEHRAEAARDRERAARDRRLAAEDRANAQMERETSAFDALTRAWQRGPGLAALQHEIGRARHANARLVVAYVDVYGLQMVDDSRGRSAGDPFLMRLVAALQAHLRSYELIIRLGDDELLLAMSNASVETVRHRFGAAITELGESEQDASITVGFAELEAGDGPTELIDRAHAALLVERARRRANGSAADAPSA